MSIISVSIEESKEQIVSGIPRFVTLIPNISANIFYTLDGSDPTIDSYIYTSPIEMPTTKPTVVLKFFATDGVFFSDTLSFEYKSNILNNTRLPHANTNAPAQSVLPDNYPFGSQPTYNNTQYSNPGDAGINVDNPALPEVNSGYDGQGNEAGFTNKPYTLENYDIRYSKTDAQGRMTPFVGNLPAKVTVVYKPEPPQESEMYKNTFDPRAMVIFQDVENQDPTDPPHINREFFAINDPDKDLNQFYNSGLDSPGVRGSFVRSHFNPKNNTITYYYFDSSTNRWLISTTKYNPNGADHNFSSIVSGRTSGARYVYAWYPYMRRVLF